MSTVNSLSELSTSRYLKKEDIDDEGVVATIAKIERENVAPDEQPAEYKGVCYFAELPKGLVLNSTNLEVLKTFGRTANDVIGKQVEVYVDPNVMFSGRRTGGIRLRAIGNKPRMSRMEVNKALTAEAANEE